MYFQMTGRVMPKVCDGDALVKTTKNVDELIDALRGHCRLHKNSEKLKHFQTHLFPTMRSWIMKSLNGHHVDDAWSQLVGLKRDVIDIGFDGAACVLEMELESLNKFNTQVFNMYSSLKSEAPASCDHQDLEPRAKAKQNFALLIGDVKAQYGDRTEEVNNYHTNIVNYLDGSNVRALMQATDELIKLGENVEGLGHWSARY